MNGLIEVEFKGHRVMVLGGPYRERPEGINGVKLAPEINAPCAVKLDIPDFSVPNVGAMKIALRDALSILESEGVIYVGCMGGIGRTGMFIALLMRFIGVYNLQHPQKKNIIIRQVARLFGKSIYKPETEDNAMMRIDPVKFTREMYLSSAVETSAQHLYINEFPLAVTIDSVFAY